MSDTPKQDNDTYHDKVALRLAALHLVPEQPVVMETHGGLGEVWQACYHQLPTGIVFEKQELRAAFLSRQRPTWAVYEANCIMALTAGVGSHLPVNFLDVDPYGEAWSTVEAFMGSARPRPSRLIVVVNDGLRNRVKLGRAWQTDVLKPFVQRYGNNLHAVYLDICREKMAALGELAGYTLAQFEGYHCGDEGKMTHYLTVYERGAAAPAN